MKMQGGQLAKVAVRHMHIKALRLVDESSPVCSHVNQLPLLNLPHSLVQSLEVFWYV